VKTTHPLAAAVRPVIEAIEARRLLAAVSVDDFAPADVATPDFGDVAAYSVNAAGTAALVSVKFDANGTGVFLDVVDADGDEVVPTTRVNATETGNQNQPGVFIDDGGNVTVVWRDGGGLDGDNAGVIYRTFGPDGTTSGGDLVLNTVTNGIQSIPVIAGNPATGDRFVAYVNGSTGNDTWRGRTLAADGTLGADSVFKADDGNESFPAITVDSTGKAFVAYSTNSTGVVLAVDDVGVSTPVTYPATFREPRLALLPSDQIGVVYENTDADNFGIAFRVLNNDLSSAVTETQINNITGGPQIRPRVAADGDGTMFVTYNSNNTTTLVAAAVRADGTVPFRDKPLGGTDLTPANTVVTVNRPFVVNRGEAVFATETDVNDAKLQGRALFVDATDFGTNGNDVVTGVQTGGDVVVSDGTTSQTLGYLGRYIRFDLGAGDDQFQASSVESDIVLDLGAGTDVARTGSGNDTIMAGDGNDSILGEGGNDSLMGEGGNDTLLGQAGDDFADGGAGADSLNGGSGDDRLLGGDDDDQVIGGDGADNLFGGDGLDYLLGGSGRDTLEGGADYDILTGGDDVDVIFGQGGDDRLNGNFGDDYLDGGAGNDRIFAGPGDDLLIGGEGNDILRGEGDDDVIQALAGNDVLIGDVGNDRLFGGDGDDTLNGGSGRDTLYGQAGNDFLGGGPSDDLMDGGDDDDTGFLRATDAVNDIETIITQ
jgi:Ca2+-binding RTX toxin-like protein